AVGLCASCWRGLCGECANTDGRMLACKGRCEQEVRRLADLRDFSFATPTKQQTLLTQAQRTRIVSGSFTLLIGAAICTFGILQPGMREIIVLGGLFGAMGIINLLLARSKARTDQFRLCPNCGYN